MKTESQEEKICCPEFNPEPWDDKLLHWENKKFIKESDYEENVHVVYNLSKVC